MKKIKFLPLMALLFGMLLQSANADNSIPLHQRSNAFWANTSIDEIERAIKKEEINKTDQDGQSPLLKALLASPDPAKINLLIRHGADVNQKNNLGNTPLMLAIISAPNLVETLLRHGADPNVGNAAGDVPLIKAIDLACKNNLYIDIVKLLLSHGADPDIKDESGATPLTFALYFLKKPTIPLMLLDHGADITIGGYKYYLPIETLRWNDQITGRQELKKRLMPPLVFLLGPSFWRVTPFDTIKNVIKVNAGKPGDLEVRDHEGRTIFLNASLNAENLDIIRFLAERGADINVRDKHNATALRYTLDSNLEIAKLLIELGADVNIPDDTFTPLMYTMHRAIDNPSYNDIVRLLLEHGADTEAEYKFPETVLISALIMQAPADLILLLLDHGARTDVKDIFGRSPWEILQKSKKLFKNKELRRRLRPSH